MNCPLKQKYHQMMQYTLTFQLKKSIQAIVSKKYYANIKLHLRNKKYIKKYFNKYYKSYLLFLF